MMGLKRIGVATAVATVTAGAAGTTSAQTGPATNARPSVSSPYWGAGNDAPQANHNGYNTPAGITTYDEPTKFMAQAVNAVPQAAADMVVAKWTYYRVNGDLNRTTNHLRDDFRNSDEYANATNELNAAYAEYNAARAEATRGLQSSSDYRAAMQLRQSVNEKIADTANANATSDPRQDNGNTARLAALAALKLDYITPVRTVEREMIAASSRVASARERLRKAAHELERQEKTFSHDVRDSIELADLRKNKENAKIAFLASWTYLEESRLARDIAIDYAYTIQHYTPRIYNAPYGGTYGYGGGYPAVGYPGVGYGYGGYGTFRRGTATGNVVE